MIPGIISGLIFAASLYLIFAEKLNRTITAIAGAVAMVGAGLALGFYSEKEAIAAVDFNTLGLLLGMMILVALLEPTGFFQYLAIWSARLSRGRPVRLLVLLGTVTTVLSMFLDNVTTVVLIAPVTILISEILGVSAVPLLMAEALLSDTGGVATLIGDPPNVLIASAAGFSFNDFLTHALPIVLVAWLTALLLLRYLFRTELGKQPPNADAVLKLNPAEALNDRTTARQVLIVLGAAILLFFVQDRLHLSPAFIAVSASAAALVWVRPAISDTLQRVEWSVLIFFAALFVMVGGLEAAGVLRAVAALVAQAQGVPPVLLGVIMLWVVAALSAVVDNVPITIALIPVIEGLGAAGMQVGPLWWALALGAGFGGNGTILGSTANIVVASLSERTRTPITSALWNRRGLPVMLATCAVASVLYVLAYPLLSR
jgi:Na+/H+ antiporter NhaD/arsenite permease-like protein